MKKLSEVINLNCCGQGAQRHELVEAAEALEAENHALRHRVAKFEMLYRQSRFNTECGVDAQIELDAMVGNVGLRGVAS